MVLWTVQHKNAYDKMLADGVLRADNNFLFCGDSFSFAYDWMSEQMSARIGKPPHGVSYPVWAWYRQNGVRKRPDMRSCGRCGAAGTPIVLITFEIPDNQVLLSDFDMWHCILCNAYLATGEKDDDSFNGSEEAKRKSWNRVFDIDAESGYWLGNKMTQATVWEIRKEQVIKAEHFISR